MAKTNIVETEIDEIIRALCVTRCLMFDCERSQKTSTYVQETEQIEHDARRQILSVARKQLYGIDSMPAKMEEARFYIGDYHAQENYPNLRLRLTDDFFQALKNSRSDGDE